MSANLYKRPGSRYWQVKFSFGGRTVRRSTRTTNLAEAERYRDELIESIRGRGPDPEWRERCKLARDDARSWMWLALARAKARGKRSGKGCTITIDVLYEVALRSNGRCEVTRTPFTDDGPLRPSLDRVDSSKGYMPENCRLVCLLVNIAMHTWGEEYLRIVSRHLVANELARGTP